MIDYLHGSFNSFEVWHTRDNGADINDDVHLSYWWEWVQYYGHDYVEEEDEEEVHETEHNPGMVEVCITAVWRRRNLLEQEYTLF